MLPPIVIDTSVIIDIFLSSRPRHSEAIKIGLFLTKSQIRIKLPMHAMFEISCAFRNIKMTGPFEESKKITETNPILLDTIAIDDAFFSKYFDTTIPYIKAGDFIFIALAKGDNAILITEDNKQFDAAKEAGINVYRIESFIDKFIGQEQK